MAIAWASVVVLAACGAEGEPPERATPSPTRAPLTLTAAEATARLDPELSGRANYVEVRIGSIQNPRAEALSLRVTLEVAGSGDDVEMHEIGRISPFPADAPGVFKLPVPEKAAAALSASPTGASVVVELEPSSADRPLSDAVKVQVDETPRFSER